MRNAGTLFCGGVAVCKLAPVVVEVIAVGTIFLYILEGASKSSSNFKFGILLILKKDTRGKERKKKKKKKQNEMKKIFTNLNPRFSAFFLFGENNRFVYK